MRRWILAGVTVAAITGVIAWLVLRDGEPTRRQRASTSRLDVPAFRAQLAERVRRAKAVTKTTAAPVTSEPPRTKVWDQRGKGPLKSDLAQLFSERGKCWAGPVAICDALAPLADECKEGDARSCIAIAQFLTENPPMLLTGYAFFVLACRIGDDEGCRRVDALAVEQDCENDPFACSWRAFKASDPQRHEEACALGAGESCSMRAFDESDAETRLAYYETGCQLGNTGACDLIVQLTAPDCDDGEGDVCLPVDEDASKRAAAIACAAGFTERC